MTGGPGAARRRPSALRFPGTRNSLIALAALVGAMVLVLALLPSGPPAPGLDEVTALASLEATGPAPAPGAEAALGWRSTGSRRDRAGDREVTTTFYENGARRAAWSVIDGAPLEPPASTPVTHEGVAYAPLREGLAWDAGDRTNTLVAPGVPRAQLLALAAAL